MRVDRLEFLAWTAAISAATMACTPQAAAAPEAVVHIPEQVPLPPATATFIPLERIDAGSVPVATAEPAPPRKCDDSTPVPAVPPCTMKNPCGEGQDVRVDCRLWTRALTPRAAAKAISCFKQTTDPQLLCDPDFREGCVHEGFLSVCPDAARFTAKCQKIVSGCAQGLHNPYDTKPISVERCVDLLSATSPSGERPMISCIEEYCGTVDESCLSFRMQHARVAP